MDQATQRQVLQAINRFYEEDGTTLADREMHHRATTYNDRNYWDREREVIRSYPVIVGHSTALAEPGDFLTDESLGLPVLICRQQDGALKAFLNICRHRGSRVCGEASGRRKVFVCPYHAWTYRADGTLLHAPQEAFPNLDPASAGLVELPVEERHGLIWLVATPGGSIDVAAHLGALDAELSAFRLGDYVVERETLRKEDLNWKYILDGFLEVYHIPKLHNDSIAPYIYGKYCVFETFGLNSRLIVPRKSFDDLRNRPLEEVDLLRHIAANYEIFPNAILVWQGDHFELWTSFPGDSPDSCIVRIQSLTTRDMAAERYQPRWDRNWKVLIDTVVNEDWAISKTVQKAIPYLTEDRVIFGRNEPGLQHFHGALADAVAAV